jgi:phenylacetate-CoA ligase
MIKFKGTTLYPPALFDLLNEMDDIMDFVVEVYSNEIGLDEVLLHLLPVDASEACDHRIRANLQARLRVSPSIIYVDSATLQKLHSPESGRKLLRFIDRRK